ncbi:MAG: methionyl-tRNA formyltransferase [Candidatus Azambacteria bacterium]|nr:methionyl-tRNA formyltransferase [Candidatus Azambacteria bacterium]
MKYVFFGTPEFAAIVLKKLINAGYIPEAVVCNPDEPVGRKQILTPPPVKSFIMKHETWNIPVLQPKKLDKNFKFQVSSFKFDLAIVAAYGKIIPEEILDIPSRGFINVHGSLLPAYRGASPIQYTILNGDKETGVTIMEVDEEMDHGPIILKSECEISNEDTFESLSQKLAILGAELLIKVIPDYISGKIKPIEQNHSKATYTKIIKKEDGKIDWSKSAEEIERMTRAFYPWPATWTIWNGKNLRVLKAGILENKNNQQIGKGFLADGNLIVKCGKDNLVIKKLQLEGGKILSAKEFLNGHKDFI